MPTPVILDCDPGTDDAVAILLALASPELSVLAITVAGGNVGLEHTLSNALAIASLAKSTVPVHAGADRPILGAFTSETRIHGETGLGGVILPSGGPPAPGHAADVIRQILRDAAEPVTLIGIGPATNLALALTTEPALTSRVKQIVLMSGAWAEGNVTPAAEFNAWSDPEALAILLASGRPVVFATLELTAQALTTPARIATWRSLGNGQSITAACDIQASLPLSPRWRPRRHTVARSLRRRLAHPPRPVHHARLLRQDGPWPRPKSRPHPDRSLEPHRRSVQCRCLGNRARRRTIPPARPKARAAALIMRRLGKPQETAPHGPERTALRL